MLYKLTEYQNFVPFGYHVANHAQDLAQFARLVCVSIIRQARMVGNLAQAREPL